MDCIGSIYFLMQIKKRVMRSIVYLLSSLLCTNINAATSSVSFFHGQLHNNPVVAENMLKVDIFYYRDFPYRQRYTHQEIKDCIKIPARGIVRCKESISLIRPENQVNSWLHSQYEKGYLPLTMKSFGVKNTAGYMNKVTPVGFLSASKKMDNLKSQYVPATGLFIRHVLDVREYTFKNIKTNVIFSVKATPEHPVYSANRRGFIPIAQLSTEDQLLSDNGEKIQLLCRNDINNGINHGIKKGCGIPYNQGRITRVYNIETSWRHTYFVQGEKLLVHNCNSMAQIKKPDEYDEGFSEDFKELDDTIAGDEDKVHLVLTRREGGAKGEWSNIRSKNRYTLEEVRALQADFEKSRNVPYGIGTIEGEVEEGGVLGIMDSRERIGAYSNLKTLSLRNGMLMNKSEPVTATFDNFDFTAEMNRQCRRNLIYDLKKNALLYTGVAIGIPFTVVFGLGGFAGLMTLFIKALNGDLK